MIYLWAVFTAAWAVTAEVLMSRSHSYWSVAWATIPLAAAVNYGVFMMLRGAPSLISALAVFSIATLMGRVGYSVAAQQSIGGGTWAAMGLLVMAGVLRHLRP